MSKVAKTDTAPIVLFVFNRPVHTRRTIEALQKNDGGSESDLFIYADAARTEADAEAVAQVREYIATVDGFKSVTVIAQEHNKGLAASIIDGVTDVVNRYGRVIVLEDDIVTSPYFLRFMNDALDHYENEKKVWHISGWNYPIDGEGIGDVFMWRLMNCWGWATWADRWVHFEKDPQKLIDTMSKDDIYRFNLDGREDFWSQVTDNVKGKIDTWAIFWYATIFQNDGLCLNPRQTLVDNIGLDGSGVHCSPDVSFTNNVSEQDSFDVGAVLCEDDVAFGRIQRFYKKRRSFFAQITRLIKKYL